MSEISQQLLTPLEELRDTTTVTKLISTIIHFSTITQFYKLFIEDSAEICRLLTLFHIYREVVSKLNKIIKDRKLNHSLSLSVSLLLKSGTF